MRIAALVLAAGASRRLGRAKQLVERHGETLLHRAARIALEAGCDPVLAVLGFEAPIMERALTGLPVQAVLNARWEEGMAASIRSGVASLPRDADAVLLLTCDQWAVEATDLQRLMEAFRADPTRIATAAYAGTRGIPAVFPRPFFAALIGLTGDRGAKDLLAAEVTLVDLPAAAEDLDLPEELAGLA